MTFKPDHNVKAGDKKKLFLTSSFKIFFSRLIMMYVEDKKNSPETRGQWFDITVLMKMHSSPKQIYFCI